MLGLVLEVLGVVVATVDELEQLHDLRPQGATHACDGWMASLDENGGVALVGVGKKSC